MHVDQLPPDIELIMGKERDDGEEKLFVEMIDEAYSALKRIVECSSQWCE